MAAIPDLKISANIILDRTIMIYGESKCGKSKIIIDILFALYGHVDQIIVFSPMDKQNETYSAGYVPLPNIHYDINKEILDSIWERQSALMSVWKRANNLDTLRSLFNRIGSAHGQQAIAKVLQTFERMAAELRAGGSETTRSQIEEMEAARDKMLIDIYKHFIGRAKNNLSKVALTDDEAYSLKFFDLNPRLVLIFDDCTDLLQTYCRHPVMKKLFFQGRWAGITMIIAGHTDKCLLTEQRKNSFMNIYASDQAASQFWGRKGAFSDDLSRRGMEAMRTAFTPMKRWQKLVWIREEDKFYRYTADLHDVFRFGSSKVWEFTDLITSDGQTQGVSSNKFMIDFI